jgi:hypothetical protein
VAFTDFFVGKHKFEDLEISSMPNGNFYWFYHSKQHRLIKQFVLAESAEVLHVCAVTLIKKQEEHFTPRLHFSTRYRDLPSKFAKTKLEPSNDALFVKASVDMGECYNNFWDLISFLKSLKALDIRDESFSLVTKDAAQIAHALNKHDKATILNVMKMLTSTPGVEFSESDVIELLQRKKRLTQFQDCLDRFAPEAFWQDFFENNKWIFGYGLNYVILRIEKQPNVGGVQFEGKGAQKGDFLGITCGDVKFTALVEIKLPSTPLLAGKEEIRNGAWSLSKELTDALVQVQANIDKWIVTSKSVENIDKLEKDGVYTVRPKGILVIGRLAEVKNGPRSRHETFERFRRSVSGIEIITFDELHERAKFIVEHTP